MKRMVTSLAMLTSLLMAGPEWMPYREGLEVAAKEKKMVIVMIASQGCEPCWYIKHEIDQDDALAATLSEVFVWVYIEVGEDPIPGGLTEFGKPTFFFLNDNGEKIDQMVGRKNIFDFTDKIEKVLKKAGV